MFKIKQISDYDYGDHFLPAFLAGAAFLVGLLAAGLAALVAFLAGLAAFLAGLAALVAFFGAAFLAGLAAII